MVPGGFFYGQSACSCPRLRYQDVNVFNVCVSGRTFIEVNGQLIDYFLHANRESIT